MDRSLYSSTLYKTGVMGRYGQILIHGPVDKMDGWRDSHQTNERIDKHTDRWIDVIMDGHTDRCKDGQMDRLMLLDRFINLFRY